VILADEAAARRWVSELPGRDGAAMERLDLLATMLAEENARQNLVAASSLDRVWQRHIADSAQLLTHVPRGTSPVWLDLGTGAGFPGLVIAALRPDLDITMVESRARRIEWLNRAREALGLERAKVAGTRLESVEARAVDVISGRAFAPLDALLTASARFSTGATLWLLPKGRSAAKELAELRGWSHLFHVEHSVTDSEAGIVVGTLAGRKGSKA